MASNADKERQSFTFRCESGVLEAIAIQVAKGTDPRVRTISDAARLGMQLVLEKLAEDDQSVDGDFFRRAAKMYREKQNLELRRDVIAAAQDRSWLKQQYGTVDLAALD